MRFWVEDLNPFQIRINYKMARLSFVERSEIDGHSARHRQICAWTPIQIIRFTRWPCIFAVIKTCRPDFSLQLSRATDSLYFFSLFTEITNSLDNADRYSRSHRWIVDKSCKRHSAVVRKETWLISLNWIKS